MLATAFAAGSPAESIDLRQLTGIQEYHPEDLTVTVQTGTTLAELQSELRKHGQWLPVDPPNPAQITIDRLLNENLSGPRRFGYGTIREHLLGITAVLADGRIIHNGGKVVKNVAGFDLCKLFVGSRWSLGMVVAATFKLWPQPVEERLLAAECHTPAHADELLEKLRQSPITPIVLDLYSFEGAPWTLVLGLAGTSAEVEWQSSEAASFGFSGSSFAYEDRFWNGPTTARRASVLPSKLVSEIQRLQPREFVSRAGNGVIYCRGGAAPASSEIPQSLNQRVKEVFDPKAILPALQS
jgi:glycolate oxidase FAD binding subunit